MVVATRVCFIWSTVFRTYSNPSIYLFPGIRFHGSSVENWFQNNNLVVYMCDKLCNHDSELASLHYENTGPWKIGQIFIISHGPILVKCPSVSDSLSAGPLSGDNSDMNTLFNQLGISLVIKIWDVITTVKTYLHFIFFDWKWMS